MASIKFHIPGHEKDQFVVLSRKHWLFLFRTIFLTAFAALIPLAIILLSVNFFTFADLWKDIVVILGAFYYLFLASYFLNEWLIFYYNTIACTQQYLIIIKQEGLVNRQILETHLVDLKNIAASMNNFWRALFGFGDLIVEIGGKYSQTIVLEMLPNPVKIADAILDAHNREAKRIRRGEEIEIPEEKLRSPELVTEFSTRLAPMPKKIKEGEISKEELEKGGEIKL